MAEKLGHFTQRVSMIAAWCMGEVFAPMTFTGTCNSSVAETWFEQVLIPTLKPEQVVILDNASFHRKATLQKLLEPLGCRLLALPPYSPDFVLDKAAHHEVRSSSLPGLSATVSNRFGTNLEPLSNITLTQTAFSEIRLMMLFLVSNCLSAIGPQRLRRLLQRQR